jgi:hypothetical protein
MLSVFASGWSLCFERESGAESPHSKGGDCVGCVYGVSCVVESDWHWDGVHCDFWFYCAALAGALDVDLFVDDDFD